MCVCEVSHCREEKVNVPLPLFQQLDGVIDPLQGHVVGNELIQHHLLLQVRLNHLRHAVLPLKP